MDAEGREEERDAREGSAYAEFIRRRFGTLGSERRRPASYAYDAEEEEWSMERRAACRR